MKSTAARSNRRPLSPNFIMGRVFASRAKPLYAACRLGFVKEIVGDIRRWRERGDEKVALATVVGTRGSAPRPIGSKLAVSEQGELAGSVSGGCVESEVCEEARAVLASGEPKLLCLRDLGRAGLVGRAFPAAARSTCSSRRSRWPSSRARRAHRARRAVLAHDGHRRRRRDLRRGLRSAAPAARLRRGRHRRGAERRREAARLADDRRRLAWPIRHAGAHSKCRRAPGRMA